MELSLWFPWNLPSAWFLAKPIMARSFEVSLFWLPLSVLHPTQPSWSLMFFSPLLFFPQHSPYSLTPHKTIFLKRSCLLPFPGGIHVHVFMVLLVFQRDNLFKRDDWAWHLKLSFVLLGDVYLWLCNHLSLILHFVSRNFSMLRTTSQFSINCVAFNKKVSEEIVAEWKCLSLTGLWRWQERKISVLADSSCVFFRNDLPIYDLDFMSAFQMIRKSPHKIIPRIWQIIVFHASAIRYSSFSK